jgi:DNA-binding transcriptional LysR family regulator
LPDVAAARSGHGIALLPEFQVIDDLRAGRLFRLLEDYPSQRVPVHIVYPSRRNVATRTRVVMDYVVELTREISAMLAQGAEVLT